MGRDRAAARGGRLPEERGARNQGSLSMDQYFILDGILKRVVSNAQGKEMILRFARRATSTRATRRWRLGTPVPTRSAVSRKCALRSSPWNSGCGSWSTTSRSERLRVRDHELMSEVMAHYHHAASAGRAGKGAAFHAQACRTRGRLPRRTCVLPQPLARDTEPAQAARKI